MKTMIEIDDATGEFVGDPPKELVAILDKRADAALQVGFGKGASKAAEEAKKQIEESIKAERLKWEASIPAERAKWEEIDASNKMLKTQIESMQTDHRRTIATREETHAAEIMRRTDAMTKRDAKIKALVKDQIAGIALAAGAREDAVGELSFYMQSRIGYTDDMEPYVLAEDGSGAQAKTAAGNPVALEAFVKGFVDSHPYHKKPAQGRGGNAPGGATVRSTHTHGGTTSATVQSATQRIQDGDRSYGAINDLFEATRSKRAS